MPVLCMISIRCLLLHQQYSVSVRSMFRRLFSTSLAPSNLHHRSYRNLQNAFTLPNPTLNLLSKTCPAARFQTIKAFRRFSCSYSQMGEARRPLSVPIPAVDKADRSELLRALEASLGSAFSSEPLCPNPSPLIIVISGPSGVGKDAVIKKLREAREGLHFVVTATSRAKRPDEVDGKDYYFVSKEEFLSMVERDELLEYALVYGDYKGSSNIEEDSWAICDFYFSCS
ncbi:hypothetical protein L6164_012660 [Bauhinia variegata]|uniref:Uncharacterized protein n=1 Tax=Bauhinia variegata TaxID=167791 RepID=A0ACB9PA85_BAUVA|nr:hypothetical protein L6164_012660 [Bauhinia variegata]